MKCWFCDNLAMQDSLICQSCSEELDRQINKKYKNMRRLLEILDAPATAKELARRLGLSRCAVYKYLVELEERGLVARRKEMRRAWVDLWFRGNYRGSFFETILWLARKKGCMDLLDCDYLQGKVPYGEYWWCDKKKRVITIHDCIGCENNFLSEVRLTDEIRYYMGSRHARVPRGAEVRLIAVHRGKMGIFEWNGERFNCPVRILWKRKPEEGW